jgi:hypothetical protein
MKSLILAATALLTIVESAHARPRRTVTISAVGHVVIATDHPEKPSYLPPADGRGLIDEVAPLVADADLSFGNLAAPISTRGKPKTWADGETAWAFRTPPRYAHVLKRLGFDVMLTANNHILDFGHEAFDDTIALLDELKIGHVGRIGEVHRMRRRGLRVAVVGFAPPYREDFQSNRDIEAAGIEVARIGQAADIVIALIHGGGEGREAKHVPRRTEYVGSMNRGRMVELSRHLVDMGADLVVGFGAHHPRAMEVYRGRIIAYALGNFLTYGPFDLKNPNYMGAVLQVTLDAEGELVEGQLVPLRLRHPGVPRFDPRGASLNLLRRLSRVDFPESPLTIREDGTLVLPARKVADSR